MLSAKREKPHLILVVLDALRADRLSAYGHGRPTSPRIDGIGTEGVLFESAIASAPWTLPSHGSLFTGLHPSEHRADDVSLRLGRGVPTLAEVLGQAGYKTVAYCPDNGWLSTNTGLLKGFQVRLGPTGGQRGGTLEFASVGDCWAERSFGGEGAGLLRFAKHVLRRTADQEAPLFLFLHSMISHQPYVPADQSWGKLGLEGPDPELTRYLQEHFRSYRAAPETITAEMSEGLNDLYDACVATADELCGALFRLVGDYLGWDNTVLVITSDHGQNLGEHGMFSHWLCLFNTLLHVPLVIYPRVFAGLPERVRTPVGQADMFHTLLLLAGLPECQAGGANHARKCLLQRALRQAPPDEYIFAEHARPDMTLPHIRRHNPDFDQPTLETAKKAALSERFKYILHSDGAESLYDLRSDPAERENVVDREEERAKRMRRALEVELGPFGAYGKTAKPENQFEESALRKLQDLGYC